MDEQYGNLKVVNDSGELTRNIKQKKKSDVSQQKNLPSVTSTAASIKLYILIYLLKLNMY